MDPSPDFQKKGGPNPSERRDPQLVAVTPRHIVVVTVLVLVPLFPRASSVQLRSRSNSGQSNRFVHCVHHTSSWRCSGQSTLSMLSSGKDCVNSFKNSFCHLSRSLSILCLAVFTCFAHRAVERHGLSFLWCLSSATRSTGSTTTSGTRAKYRVFFSPSTRSAFSSRSPSAQLNEDFTADHHSQLRMFLSILPDSRLLGSPVLGGDGLVSCCSCLPLACFCMPTHTLPFGSRGRGLLR